VWVIPSGKVTTRRSCQSTIHMIARTTCLERGAADVGATYSSKKVELDITFLFTSTVAVTASIYGSTWTLVIA
jgi:hypothetical protein